MPRNDGTGPMGMGAMTGRGMGSCVEFVTDANINPALGRGMGNGCGRRRMHGSGGRGAGWKQKCNTKQQDSGAMFFISNTTCIAATHKKARCV